MTNTADVGVSRNIAVKPRTAEAVRWVTSGGSDSDDGLSIGTAKLTVAGACASFSGGNAACTAGYGTIYVTNAVTPYYLPAGATPEIALAIETSPNKVHSVIRSGPNPDGIDLRAFGGRPLASPQNTITVSTNGTTSVHVSGGLADFQVGDDLVISQAGGATTQTTPSAPTLNVIGVTGSSSVSYKCAGQDTQWGFTAAGAAATATTVPANFGAAPTAISSVTWSENKVTVHTSTSMPFSTGTMSAMIGNITAGGTQIGGIQTVTIASATQFSYTLTGSGTVTVGSNASVLFAQAMYPVSRVSETAGSTQIVITTKVKHNLQQQLVNNHPTLIFLDGISFAGESPTGYANGPFTITSVTSNTITVTTQHVAALTENATASRALATSKVAQMSVLTWPEVLVTCPQRGSGVPSTGGIQYLVYANYGSGYAPIGFTPYNHSIFVDYGPTFNKAEFNPPPSMGSISTPPSSPLPQVYEGKIVSISGSTLTMDRAVTQTLTNVTGYHSNGISLQNAVNMSCQRNDRAVANQNFYPVFIPAASGSYLYTFNAPVDIAGGANHCNRASIVDSGSILANGTIYSSRGPIEWLRGSGYNTFPNGYSGGQVLWGGLGEPQLADTVGALKVVGMSFTTSSGNQIAVYSDQPGSYFERDSFVPGANYPTSTPLVLGGAGFQDTLKSLFFGAIPNIQLPLGADCGNCGQVMYWPVCSIWLIGGPSNMPDLWWDNDMNYGNGTGLCIDQTYPGPGEGLGALEMRKFQTFQEPWQPLITVRGESQISSIRLEFIQMDSILMPAIMFSNPSSCTGVLTANQVSAAGSSSPTLTGYPCRFVVETEDGSATAPMQNTAEDFTNASGRYFYGPVSTSTEKTITQCISSASPAVCGSNIDGFVTIAAGASNVVVDTTAVTANSDITLTFDSSQGANLGVSCNTTAQQPYISARTAGKSFTISVPAKFSANPGCIAFHLKN